MRIIIQIINEPSTFAVFSGTVSAGPRNNIYHLACHICRNYLLCITEILCLAGVGRFFTGEGD